MKNIDDEFNFSDLAKTLADQVNTELESDDIKDDNPDDFYNEEDEFDVDDSGEEDFFIDLDGVFDEDFEENFDDDDADKEVKRKMPFWAKAGIIAFVVTCIVAVPVVFLLAKLGLIYNDWSNTKEQDEEFEWVESIDPDHTEYNMDEIDWSNAVQGSTRYDENVVNILLIGEDGQSDQGYRGNSDTMIIFTINKTEKTVKMTSLMRDLYIRIPEHSDNKINSAYCTGGVPLLKQTIEENFKVAIDYAIVVQFDTYKVIIDKLGGVDVEINEEEAEFINEKCASTGSNLTAGMQHLDGRQTLWFSRIRKISSDIYGENDFGRTARQRAVLTQIFDSYKDLSYTQIISIANDILPYIQTDMKPDTIIKCAALILSYKVNEIESLRIPIDGAYENAYVYFESVGMDLQVLVMNDFIEENVDAMHMFIYGNLLY